MRDERMSPEARFVGIGAAFVALILAGAGAATAQTGGFSARLTWVPISGSERDQVAGQGSVSATLSRSMLSITGEFHGLPAAATHARVHQGVVMGARGPAIAELSVTRSADGALSGRVELTPEQREALVAGRLYVQVHGERGVAPDDALLWGWLLAEESAP